MNSSYKGWKVEIDSRNGKELFINPYNGEIVSYNNNPRSEQRSFIDTKIYPLSCSGTQAMIAKIEHIIIILIDLSRNGIYQILDRKENKYGNLIEYYLLQFLQDLQYMTIL